MAMHKLEAENVAEALLELLALRGIEYFIAGGAGTDFPYIIEAFARAEAEGRKVPTPITAVHEINAVAMAHGYTMVSGKPIFTMLHTIVGLANGIGGVINASRARVPLFLCAGKTATAESGHAAARFHVVQWGQEAFDQAGMLREFVKWDYQLQDVAQLEASIDRGLAIAEAAPSGPVYMTLPVEVGGQPIEDHQVASSAKIVPPAASVPSSENLDKAIELLLGAQKPCIITASLGRKPDAVAQLVQFAETLAIPVLEYFPTHMNFPRDHALHAGFEVDEYIAAADLVMVIEHDAPWTRVTARPGDEATIIVLDDDPLYCNYPYRGFPADLLLCGDAKASLQALNQALQNRKPDDKRLSARLQECKREHDGQAQKWKANALAVKDATPIQTSWLSHCVGEIFNAETDILLTEFVLDPTQVCVTRPGSYFDHSHAGGLGWCVSAALGAKLAAPEKNVICCVGEGSYTFGVPLASHHMSAMHELPVLYIIFNNAAYERTRLGSRRVIKQGKLQESAKVPLCELEPVPAYEKICEAAGGYAERVDAPAELPAALERALKVVVDEGRQALVNVICAKS